MEARVQRPEGTDYTAHTQHGETTAYTHTPQTKGIWTDQIEGRYRKITVHQLAMAWWCLQAGHITLRQLRVYLASHEMAERRRYTPQDYGETQRRPLYGIDEIRSLVGGKESKTSDAALHADVKHLGKLGLVGITDHTIDFAISIEQIRVDGVGGFWTMFEQLRHKRRSVPVPRRVLRAMSGRFTRGMTAVTIATLIRSLFWHKSKDAYRVDGRTKREWITEVFGISQRTITDARGKLIEIGWLIPLETSQIMLNRFGTHDQINTDWSPAWSTGGGNGGAGVLRGVFSASDCAPRSASPNRDFSGGSASPDLNRSLPLTGNLNTRKPRPQGAGTAEGDRRKKTRKPEAGPRAGSSRGGSRGHRGRASGGCGGDARRGDRGGGRPAPGEPNIRDIRASDLADTDRLLSLHSQACKLGLSSASEHGRVLFLSLAERARQHGTRSGALFFWLLRENKSEFITQNQEDAASGRIRRLNNGQRGERQWWGGDGSKTGDREKKSSGARGAEAELTDDERFVVACIRAAQKSRGVEPAHIARMGRGWTRQRWDDANTALDLRKINECREALGDERE